VRFFFYGTLMDLDLLRMVLGRDLAAAALRPAILTGYRRGIIRGRSYPMLVPRAHGSVDGVLARDFDEADALRLTWYEHDHYDIRLCRPRLACGLRVAAWTFVPRCGGGMPPGAAWSLPTWQRRHKAAFLARLTREIGAGGPAPRKMAQAKNAWRRRRP